MQRAGRRAAAPRTSTGSAERPARTRAGTTPVRAAHPPCSVRPSAAEDLRTACGFPVTSRIGLDRLPQLPYGPHSCRERNCDTLTGRRRGGQAPAAEVEGPRGPRPSPAPRPRSEDDRPKPLRGWRRHRVGPSRGGRPDPGRLSPPDGSLGPTQRDRAGGRTAVRPTGRGPAAPTSGWCDGELAGPEVPSGRSGTHAEGSTDGRARTRTTQARPGEDPSGSRPGRWARSPEARAHPRRPGGPARAPGAFVCPGPDDARTGSR